MIKPLDPDLYAILCDWWESQNFTCQPIDYLPDNSFFSCIGDKPIFFLSFYHDKKLGIMTWPTANPEASFGEREEALSELVDHIQKTARDLGVKVILTGVSSKTLVDRLVRNGFVVADQNVIHLFKGV